MLAHAYDDELKAIWRAYGEGRLTDEAAQAAAEAVSARRARPGPIAPPASSKPASARRCCGSRPRSSESLQRRRRWVASGRMPPAIAARFTMAEAAALAVVAVEATKRGDCRLSIGHIAAVAGVSVTVVKNAIREARRLGLIDVEERRVSAFRNLPNIVTIVDRQWSSWLRLRGGGRFVPPTCTVSNSYSSRPVISGARASEGAHENLSRTGRV